MNRRWGWEGLQRRWGCDTCGQRFRDRARPKHDHPLHSLCRYAGCEVRTATYCSDEHAVLYNRLGRGLPESLAPRHSRSGLALFARRRAMGLSRAQVAELVGCNWQAIWWAEVLDQETKQWDNKLLALWEPGPSADPLSPQQVASESLHDPLFFTVVSAQRQLNALAAAFPHLLPDQRAELYSYFVRTLRLAG